MATYRLGKACVYRIHLLCVSRCSFQLWELKTLLCFKWKYQHAAVSRSSSGPGAKPWMAVPSRLAVCFVSFSILSEKGQALLLVHQEPHPGKVWLNLPQAEGSLHTWREEHSWGVWAGQGGLCRRQWRFCPTCFSSVAFQNLPVLRDVLGTAATKDPHSWEVLVPDALESCPKWHFLMCAFNSGFVWL